MKIENMTEFDIYLYVSGNTKEPSNWDLEFSYFFGEVLRKIMPDSPRILCNANVPATILAKPLEVETKDIKAFFFLIGGENPMENDFDLISQLIAKLSVEQQKNIVVIGRPQRFVSEIPKALKNYTLFNFFEVDPFSRKVLEFSPNSDDDARSAYWDKITDLAYELKHMLFTRAQSSISKERINTIFLAEVTADQQRNLHRLRRELLLSGYHVIPESQYSIDYNSFNDEVRQLLSKCVLSVHIMGEVYGDTPELSDYSYQEIQNRMFIEEARKAAAENFQMNRIIWIQSDYEPYDEKQAQYMKRLSKDINTLQGSELIQSTLHDLKMIIDQKMSLLGKGALRPQMANTDKYLIIPDNKTDVAVCALCDELHKRQIPYEILNPPSKFELNDWMENIKGFSNIILMNTNSQDVWCTNYINLLARSRGYDGASDKPAVGVFSPLPVKTVQTVRTLNIDYFTYNGQNIETLLQDFVSKQAQASA
jgi:hypothetical protein